MWPDVSVLPMWANGLIVVATIVAVGFGAHWVVDAAARIAKRFGVSELVIGLTIVALGTSAPEFVVTLTAAANGQGDISVSNVVGSNIFNLGFILGGCALVRAIPTSATLLKRDGMVLGGTTILLLLLIGTDLSLDRYDGAILCALLGLYLGLLFWQRRHGEDGGDDSDREVMETSASLPRDLLVLVGGLAAIIIGSHFLVDSATALARGFGVSEWVIGVTIVAAGTSTPELATTLAGVVKGRYAISAGNVIGSDIFNMLGVLGLAGILQPMQIDPMGRVSLIALCGMVLLAVFFMRTGWKVSRLEGATLVLIALVRWVFDFSGS